MANLNDTTAAVASVAQAAPHHAWLDAFVSARWWFRWLTARRTIWSRTEISRRRAGRPRMPAANLLSFLSLLRRKHRIQLPTSPADDRIQLGLDLASNGAQLSPLTIHDGIDPGLLLRREADLLGKSIPELPIPRRWPSREVLEPGPEHSRKQHMAIQCDAGHSADKQR
jgi:hypothetical protein